MTRESIVKITLAEFKAVFQVTESNHLEGCEGRLALLHNLAKALGNGSKLR